MKLNLRAACSACLLAASTVSAITLDLTSKDSIKSAAKTIANEMLATYYKGDQPGQTPGILTPTSYYWWEAGAMWGALIDYWRYTGDDSFNTRITQAMMFQAAPGAYFEPQNYTKQLGNDDQAFWAISALMAAEYKFPNPPSDQPQWLALVQAVFNRQAARWDTTSCGGGLKWQIVSINGGYDYKNSISNGCFFNMAARLGMYTTNSSYFDWANKAWDWTAAIGLIGGDYKIYDGSDDTINCTRLNGLEWTYNTGVFLYGAAVMWNQTNGTEQAKWKTRINGLLNAEPNFFGGSDNLTLQEYACESVSEAGNCNIDQPSFKGYYARWMAATLKVAPWTSDVIMPRLQASAKAAALACTGGSAGTTCGQKWTTGKCDGNFGAGQQMSALETIQSNLIQYVDGPVGNRTGATSVGNAAAGTGSGDAVYVRPITTGDKAGAGILTALIIIGTLGGTWYMLTS